MTDSSQPQDLPRPVQLLIYRLQLVHGPGVLSRGDNGLHLAIASPMALMKDGSRELYKRHLYVNLDRYLGLHPYEDLSQEERENSGWCVKYRVPYDVGTLLDMPTLEARGHSRGNVAPGEQTITTMVPDFVPDLAGKLTPLLELPSGHPGVLYLRQRGYDLGRVQAIGKVAFCSEEAPENPDKRLYYKKLAGGFRVTPRNRLVFHIELEGKLMGWQGRVLEHHVKESVEDHVVDTTYYLHPYTNQWVAVSDLHIYTDGTNRLLWRPPFDFKFDIAKYWTAPGTQRKRALMGFDAALALQAHLPRANRVVGLVEGPLDAGRMGPPFCAVTGKYFSDEQARLVSGYFGNALMVRDNDESGELLAAIVLNKLSLVGVRTEVARPPAEFKDIGEMSNEQADAMFLPRLTSLRNN